MLIPKIIWQTYKDQSVDDLAKPFIQSWKQLNPEFRYEFQTDSDIDSFMEEHFDAKTVDVFRAFPLGVMRADMWRYAVLYVHGGIYADIDAECLIPAKQWINSKAKLVIGLEDSAASFCQWTIASVPGHPLLASVIDLVCERSSAGVDSSSPHFVHHYTGPSIWTDAIRSYLGAKGSSARDIYEQIVG